MISKQTWDKWHVLEKDRIIITDRDKNCVYCNKGFNSDSSKLKETVEHIDNETWKKNPGKVERNKENIHYQALHFHPGP